MRTLPGTLSTPTAGPILCPGAPLLVLIPEVHPTPIRATSMRPEPMDGLIEVAYRYGGVGCWEEVPADNVSLDLTADLGPTTALRWLGRHYEIDVGMTAPEWGAAGWGIWDLRARDGSHVGFTADAATAKKFSDPKRGIVHHVPALANVTDPLEALVAACVHAGGASR